MQRTRCAGDGRGADNRPSESQLRSWLASGLSSIRILRDAGDIYSILEVQTGDTNASSVDVTAYDLQANYRLNFDRLGSFRVNLQATYIDSFLYQEDSTKPIIEAAGKYNDTTGVAPELPQIRANLRMSWNKGNHAIVGTAHYVDALPYDGPLFTHLDFFANYNRPGNVTETGVKAWSDLDLSYTYRNLDLMGNDANITLGARNLFDREAQRSPEFAGVIGGLQDPLGRVITARLQVNF